MAVIWCVCDRRQRICGWLGWNDIRYANGLAGGACAILRNIQKSTSRKREGFGYSGMGDLIQPLVFRLLRPDGHHEASV